MARAGPAHDPAKLVPESVAKLGAWSWRLVVAALAAGAVGYVLLQISAVVVHVVVALFLASVLDPVVSALRRHGWPSWLAAGVVFLAAVSAGAGLGYWLVTTITGQLDELGEHVRVGLMKANNGSPTDHWNCRRSSLTG